MTVRTVLDKIHKGLIPESCKIKITDANYHTMLEMSHIILEEFITDILLNQK